MAAAQGQTKNQKAKKRKRNTSNSNTTEGPQCLTNGNTHIGNLKEGKKKKQKKEEDVESNVKNITVEPASEITEHKNVEKEIGKKKKKKQKKEDNIGNNIKDVNIEPESEIKESIIGEKEIGKKMEMVSPINAEKMTGQNKKKQKKRKKGGGLQMEGGVNAEENKEDGNNVGGNMSQEEKEGNKEEGKKGNLLQGEEKEGNKEEEKKIGGNMSQEEKEEGKKIGGNLSQEEEKEENNVTEGKKKRNKKKKKVADDTNTTTTTTPLSPDQKKRKMGQESQSSIIKEKKEETTDNDASPAKKMKVEAAERAKDGTGKKNKKKNRKKKGKGNQGGNAAMNESTDEGKGMDESRTEDLNENDGKEVASTDEGKDMNENDEKKVAVNNMNKPASEESTIAKTNKKNIPNKPQDDAGKFDTTAKKNAEENKTDAIGNQREKKKGKKSKKRKGKGNQSDSNVKEEDNNEEEKEKDEEEEEEVPSKKMKKDNTKNQKMKDDNKETKMNDDREEDMEETPAETMKNDNTKNQEVETDAKIDQENSTQPVLTAKQKKQQKKKQRKALKKQAARTNTSSPQTSTAPPSATTLKPDAKTDQENSSQPVLSAKQKKQLKKKQRKALKKQGAMATASSPQTGTAPPSASTDRGVVAPLLHSSCSSESSKEKIKSGWRDGAGTHKKSVIEGDVEVIRNPFLACYIQNLLEDEEFLEGVKKELNNIPLLSKNNDLYKFQQTADLKDITTPYISALRDFLYKDMRIWLQDITGLALQDTVDMGSSRYSHTDVLLCHDDVLEGRLIAYILYLVPPWHSEDGGTLDLFSCDDNAHPKDIVRSLVPKNNAFAFFQVCPESFHQVSEVLSRNKTRLSINGWFHGPSVRQQKEKPPPPLPLLGPGQLEEEDFYHWINPMYLDMETQKEIRKKFCAESELELQNFLTDEAYELLGLSLLDPKGWKQVGPPNRHCYEVLQSDAMPQKARECQQFLQCEAFFLVLSQLTGLRLHPMAPQDSDDDSDDEKSPAEPNPRCQVELQRWGHKCYSLLRDDCVDRHSALDAYLFVNVTERWKQEMGGHITYIAKDEDEELLTVVPRRNCLSLVYCDAETLRFTKYINSTCLGLEQHKRYHSFSCVYYE